VAASVLAMTESGDPGRGRRTQAQRRAESEERLLRAFAELVVEKGVTQTSLNDIGRRAGYSHTLVHHLFGSKAALLARLTESVERFAWDMGQRAAEGHSGRETLLAVATGYLEMVIAESNPLGRVLVVLSCEAVAGSAELRAWSRQWDTRMRSAFADVIRTGIADGSISPQGNPDEVAVVILGLLRGVGLQALGDGALDLPSAQRVVTSVLGAVFDA
jgi:AcrR family transcriptional regulator